MRKQFRSLDEYINEEEWRCMYCSPEVSSSGPVGQNENSVGQSKLHLKNFLVLILHSTIYRQPTTPTKKEHFK